MQHNVKPYDGPVMLKPIFLKINKNKIFVIILFRLNRPCVRIGTVLTRKRVEMKSQ